jgi:cell volume regulation protein A
MAYLLLITFLQLVQHQSSGGAMIVSNFFYALIVGALCGFLLGKLAIRVINKVNMTNDALYPILLLAMCFIIFLVTDLINGSGFLAVYIGGLTVGNSRFVHKRSSKNFFDGFAWLAQIMMFFTFGMLVNPAELLPIAALGIMIGIFVIIFARPLAVWSSIGFFRKIPAKAKFFVSWVGLRGAVPLIFATYVLAADIPNGQIMFNIVFFIMLVSLLVQGTTVSFFAKILKLGNDSNADKQVSAFDVEFSEDIKQAMTEITMKKEHLQHGNTLMTMQIPEHTLVVMVRRGNSFFVPKGNTEIQEGDILLMISDNEQAMRETYEKMRVRYNKTKKLD